MVNRVAYWKYSIAFLIIFLGIVIFKQASPYMSGVLGACTIYILVRKQMVRLVEVRKIKKIFAALIVLLEVVLCILIPTFLVIWLLLGKIESVDLHPMSLLNTAQDFLNLFHSKTGYDLVNPGNVGKMAGLLTQGLQLIVGQISAFIINAIVLLFILYFMLLSNRKMEEYVYDLLPFNDVNKKHVVKEIKMMVKSNAIGIPLLAIIQGTFAGFGYYFFDAPSPVLFAFLTCFATILPLIGTSLIWFPLAVYLAMSGNWFGAIGLAIYCLGIVSNIDSVVRFMLQKKMANTHPLITVFGVILGLPLFGFWGVIFGPLLLSMFFLLVDIFKREYIDSEKSKMNESMKVDA